MVAWTSSGSATAALRTAAFAEPAVGASTAEDRGTAASGADAGPVADADTRASGSLPLAGAESAADDDSGPLSTVVVSAATRALARVSRCAGAAPGESFSVSEVGAERAGSATLSNAPPCRPPCAAPFRVLDAELRSGPAEPELAEAAEPEDPAEPVVSANATGMAKAAEPTPRAKARAPTRPTCVAGVPATPSHAGSFTHMRADPITRIAVVFVLVAHSPSW
jgi:hypothetical protein